MGGGKNGRRKKVLSYSHTQQFFISRSEEWGWKKKRVGSIINCTFHDTLSGSVVAKFVLGLLCIARFESVQRSWQGKIPEILEPRREFDERKKFIIKASLS